MELTESERELRTQYELETGKEHREWNEGKVLSADYVKWLEAKLSERTSEAHGEVSPLEALVRFLERHRHDISELFLHKVQDEMEVEYKDETFDGNEVYFQNAGKIGFDVVDEIISLLQAKET